ncbi:hypothetical protein HUW51_19390 [Adhaeribacter swui]|uniref:Uncharacterized protein n=1 Tax=Adhaeribacter swui TaxID=2086471 RepID=A0A7G7GCA0_9BACT|nr:hypothetical protein [Adhaeribacter swui]QNF34784.1 hypothetical protein HUW51_19390 [Adhaeribacter swui]
MKNFEFEPSDSQEENLESFFAFAIEKNPILGQILYNNKELLLQFENDLSNPKKLEIRTKITKEVQEALNTKS